MLNMDSRFSHRLPGGPRSHGSPRQNQMRFLQEHDAFEILLAASRFMNLRKEGALGAFVIIFWVTPALAGSNSLVPAEAFRIERGTLRIPGYVCAPHRALVESSRGSRRVGLPHQCRLARSFCRNANRLDSC